LLGIDGGGTKTEFVVFKKDGTALKKVVLEGCNPNDVGFDESINILKKGIDLCLMEYPEISAVFCGIAGAGAGNNKVEMLKKLSALYGKIEFGIDTDVANIIALDERNSVYLICGTGSIVMTKTKDGIKRFGGWGYLFDEQGSAYDIGKDAIRAVLAQNDGIGEVTILKELLEEKLNGKLWDKIKVVYDNGKPFIASLAPLVFDAYKQGDVVAQDIIDKNCKRLAVLLNGAFKYSTNKRVTVGGGLIGNFSSIMLKHLSKYTSAEFIIPNLPPVYGACVCCCELASVETNEKFRENFSKNYELLV
jgi:N-acetylglucosamine kinase-like BadF-type ATPase